MKLTINGTDYEVAADPQENLLSVLRNDLDLTGSKYGCGEGACGACTVLINGNATRSCVTAIGTLAGKRITTIEGIARNGELHPVQKVFLSVDVFQCAYCASGMIMSAVSLLNHHPKPDEAEINNAMQGNVCRCGTHTRIVRAIQQASATTSADASRKQ